MTSPKYYLTTPIYYVNARPHIGHAYSTIVADVIARRHRLLGDDTYFLTGTDEHGQKIERSAQAAGVPPQEFADRISKTFADLWKRMGITNDDYIRTTEERHKRGVQKLFRTLQEKGFIYLDTYTGQYCVSDEAFVEVGPGEPCPDCGRITETVSESNYYFKLSAFGDKLLALIDPAIPGEQKLTIEPASARNEVLAFIRSGLKDLSISRTSFKWGIPVPGDEEHVIYVWLDALANYMTAVGYGDGDPAKEAEFAKWWPADLHLVGKEITRFHCVYWPAFLMAAELPTPKAIVANGWLLFEESKMSKSKGNVVRTETILDGFGSLKPELAKAEQDLFGADVLRYFLLREIPFGQDGSFSFDALVTRYNADLANGYGNLVSRVLNLIQQNFGGGIPNADVRFMQDVSDEEASLLLSNPPPAGYGTKNIDSHWVIASANTSIKTVAHAFGSHDLSKVAESFKILIGVTDFYLSAREPWKLAKAQDLETNELLKETLYVAAEAIRIITALFYPLLPDATAKVWEQLGLGDIEVAAKNGELKDLKWGGLKPGTKLGVLGPVFPRADKGLVETMTNMEVPAGAIKPNDDQTEGASTPVASSAPHAGPRTGELNEASSGTHVGGSHAVTTERAATPGHAEVAASGVFRAEGAPAEAATVPETPQIGIDDFAKVDLRVAKIVVAERIPKADKLLRLEVDLGYEKRQILSGIAEWYQPEDLIGRKIVIIANLAPRKMRGLESHGMLLAASHGDHGKPVLATFGEEIELGSRLR